MKKKAALLQGCFFLCRIEQVETSIIKPIQEGPSHSCGRPFLSGVGWRSDSQKFITSDNAWLLDVIANANPVAASDYDSIIAYCQRTNRLSTRTCPDCSLQTVGAFSRAVVGPIVVDFTPVTRRRVRLLARETGNMTTFDRPAACLTCQPFESAHPPLSPCSRVTAGPSRCASWAWRARGQMGRRI